jgi:hypothetical protein
MGPEAASGIVTEGISLFRNLMSRRSATGGACGCGRSLGRDHEMHNSLAGSSASSASNAITFSLNEASSCNWRFTARTVQVARQIVFGSNARNGRRRDGLSPECPAFVYADYTMVLLISTEAIEAGTFWTDISEAGTPSKIARDLTSWMS